MQQSAPDVYRFLRRHINQSLNRHTRKTRGVAKVLAIVGVLGFVGYHVVTQFQIFQTYWPEAILIARGILFGSIALGISSVFLLMLCDASPSAVVQQRLLDDTIAMLQQHAYAEALLRDVEELAQQYLMAGRRPADPSLSRTLNTTMARAIATVCPRKEEHRSSANTTSCPHCGQAITLT